MTRSTARSPEYLNMATEARMAGEKSDCAVKAVALAAGISYTEALHLLTRLGRKPQQGTKTSTIFEAMRLLGKTCTQIDQRTITARYPGKHSQKTHVTTNQPQRFPRAWADGKTYLMFTKGHVLTIINGVNHDWSVSDIRPCIWLYEVN